MTDEQNERAARVWREACAAFEDAADPELPKFENVNAGDRAATAVIAREIEADRAKIEALEAENARLREALEEIMGLPGEINPSNYDHDDVCELNRQFCYGYAIARAALGASHDADA